MQATKLPFLHSINCIQIFRRNYVEKPMKISTKSNHHLIYPLEACAEPGSISRLQVRTSLTSVILFFSTLVSTDYHYISLCTKFQWMIVIDSGIGCLWSSYLFNGCDAAAFIWIFYHMRIVIISFENYRECLWYLITPRSYKRRLHMVFNSWKVHRN